jgi:nonsense-mediated mRNA decay protein 3
MARKRFCYLCGRETEGLVEGLCGRCYFQEKEFLRIPDRVEAVLCRGCLAYRKGRRWIPLGNDPETVLEDAVRKAVLDSLKMDRVEDPEIVLEFLETKAPSPSVHLFTLRVRVEGEVKGLPFREEGTVEVRVGEGLCPDCSRRAGGYYEAILQLRGEKGIDGERRRNLLDRMEERTALAARKDRKAFVTKIEEREEGIDFYLGSLSFARKAVRDLQQVYGGTITESATLVGADREGKRLYRTTLSLRFPPYQEGDILRVGKKPYQVVRLGVEKASLFDLESRKKVSLPFKALQGAERLGGKKETRKALVAEVLSDRIQLIDMEDFRTLSLKGRYPLRVGEEVEVFLGDETYLLRGEREG